MVDELRFRAYSKSLGMSKEFGLKDTINSDIDEFDIYMQCTGKTDKNNKNIYKGDIVNCLNVGCMPITDGFGRGDYGSQYYKEYKLGIIIYDNDRAEFQIEHPRWRKCNLYQYDDIEVIGNIYENPEILEQVA